MIETSNAMSPKESLEHEWYVEEARLAREHSITMKQLEIAEQKLEAQWASWIKIPLTVVKLPVYMIMALGYIVAMARKGEVPEKFWDYLK